MGAGALVDILLRGTTLCLRVTMTDAVAEPLRSPGARLLRPIVRKLIMKINVLLLVVRMISQSRSRRGTLLYRTIISD